MSIKNITSSMEQLITEPRHEKPCLRYQLTLKSACLADETN